MLKTGFKESIINVEADIVYDSSILKIKDVGQFNIANIAKLSIQAPIPARLTTAIADTLTVSAAGSEIVTVTMKFKSISDTPGFENMLMSGTKELKTSFTAGGTVTDVAVSLVAALNGAAEAYGINVATNAAGVVSIKYNDPSVYMDSIEVIGVHNVAVTTVAAVVNTIPANMGRGTAKELYDSVRLGTGINYKPYTQTAERQVNMNSSYYTISFDYLSTGNIGVDGINAVANKRSEFILYVENSIYVPDIDKAGAGDELNDFWIAYVAQSAITAAGAGGEALWLASDVRPIYFDATLPTGSAVAYPESTP